VDAKLVKKQYMDQTQAFYAKYGPKTIVLARFVPIVRTFAPFVAGVGSMAYQQFALYNVVGALLWTGICTLAGYCFGNIPVIHENFSLVVLGIIAVSVLPVLLELFMAGRHGRAANGGRSGKVVRNGGSLNVSFT
jgi:membrane-associated protein